MKTLIAIAVLMIGLVSAWPTTPAATRIDVSPVAATHDVALPPRPADPYVMWMNSYGQPPTVLSTGERGWKLRRDVVSPTIGFGFGQQNAIFDLDGKTIWAAEAGFAFAPASGALLPVTAGTARNGTVIAPRLTEPGSEGIALKNITLITDQAAVGTDQKLPLSFRAISEPTGQTSTVTNIQVTVTNGLGTWVPRAATDPAGVDGYFDPGPNVGTEVLVVTGLNRKGQPISGQVTIEILGAAATIILVDVLPPIDK